MKKKIVGIFFMMLLIATAGHSVISETNEKSMESINYNVVWDNGIHYDALGTCQIDEIHDFDFISSDDVLFEKDTTIDAIKAIGGYRYEGYQDANTPWDISIYIDQGNGNVPGEIFKGPYTYTLEMLNPIFLEDTGTAIIYELLFDLPETITLTAGEKYWIVPTCFSELPTQGGFAYHFDPIKLHQAVAKSEYFNSPHWQNVMNISTQVNAPIDGSFQLLSVNSPPAIPNIDGPTSGETGEQQDFTFFSTDPDGNDISYYIDWGDETNSGWIGPLPSGDEITQSHTWEEDGTFTVNIKAKDTHGEESEFGSLEIAMPKAKMYIPSFLRLFENYHFLSALLELVLQR
jgi:hypothetical protein